MDNLNFITPEGTKDYIFEEAAILRKAERQLSEIFLENGCNEVITPGIEFYELFGSYSNTLKSIGNIQNSTQLFSPETIYSFTDERGRLLALRRDCTLPIARLCATRLKNHPLPLKLFYNQTIYSSERKNFGAADEVFQSGVEIIGLEKHDGDLECLRLAVKCLDKLGIKNYRFEIGDCRFFNMLFEDYAKNTNVSSKYEKELRTAAEFKRYSDLPEGKIRTLAGLFGGNEAIIAAEELFRDNPKLLAALDYFKTVFYSGITDFSSDLCCTNLPGYYTGLVFSVYVNGIGSPILSGGRYDKLMNSFGRNLPAIGFGIYLNSYVRYVLEEQGKHIF